MSFTSKYFEKINADASKCKICLKVIATKGSSTSGKLKHLAKLHGIVNTDQSQSSFPQEALSQPKQSDIRSFTKYTSLEETIARMVAEDGIKFRQVTKSGYIRKSLEKDFPTRTIPKNQSGMLKLVGKFYTWAREVVTQKFEKAREEDQKFSLTLDEWTSHKNARYLNLNLHCYDVLEDQIETLNLGMVKVKGSCPAKVMISMVNNNKFSENFNQFKCVCRLENILNLSI